MSNSSWYPNNALPAWVILVIAIVAVGTLALWLVAVYRADKDQSKLTRTTSAGSEPAATATGENAPAAERRAA